MVVDDGILGKGKYKDDSDDIDDNVATGDDELELMMTMMIIMITATVIITHRMC